MVNEKVYVSSFKKLVAFAYAIVPYGSIAPGIAVKLYGDVY